MIDKQREANVEGLSPTANIWIWENYVRGVQNFLDDPEGTCPDGCYTETILNFIGIGAEFGINFIQVAREVGTPFELKQLSELAANREFLKEE